jgi:hypothetical protein
MVARVAGAVGCAHCKVIGADTACQVCTRLVCSKCAADWATCDEPSGRVVRLGLTARVRDVDPLGRFALVSHWRQPLRLFDLRQLRWVEDITFSRKLWLTARSYPPRLTSNGRLVYPEFEWVGRGDYAERRLKGIRAQPLHGVAGELFASDEPARATAVSGVNDRYYYITSTERVAIIDPSVTSAGHGVASVVEPLPRKVLQAVHVDGERDLLAASSWSEIVLHRIVDANLQRLSYTKTEIAGDVPWIACAGPWLVAAIKEFGSLVHIEVRRIERDQSIGEVVHRHFVDELRAASLSRDGRYLALASDRGLHVYDLDDSDARTPFDITSTTFDEHTDRINYVRFAGDDHVLISADTDNRVVLRPRTRNGYACPLLAVDVPEQGVPLPSFAPQ